MAFRLGAAMTPSFGEALRVWARIGVLSFGGPAAQIALMHRILVDEKGWLSERQYLNALSFCMLLPGPEAMQLATYSGWRLHGVAGGLAAGLLFVLPGAAVILTLAAIYLAFGAVPALQAVFVGVKAAVLVIVVEALLRVAKKGLTRRGHWVIAGLSFLAIFAMNLPFPLVILAAALWGFLAETGGAAAETPAPGVPVARTVRTVALWLAIWVLPLAAVALAGPPVLGDIGYFFSKLALVTFGGAYAVLAYMAQDAVQAQGWLTAAAMMDGLGLAETTPGPLILVTEFVGFLAAARAGGGFWMGLAGAVVTLWATFAPCFLWIFAGAPYIEWISGKARLRSALTAITAAVVGVILNLSLWFSLHVLFGRVNWFGWPHFGVWWPEWESLHHVPAVLSLVAGWLLLRRHVGVGATLAVSAVLGFAAGLLPG